MNKRITIVLAMLVLGISSQGAQVKNLTSYQHPKSKITILSGEVDLPGTGIWMPVPQVDPSPVTSILLDAPPNVQDAALGKRQVESDRNDCKNNYTTVFRNVGWAIRTYAEKNEGRMPTPSQLDDYGRRSVEEAFQALPVRKADLRKVPEPPYAALIPDTVFKYEEQEKRRRYSSVTNKHDLIMVELYPAEDDGKHYVLYTGGDIARVPIDQELMKKYGLEVVPLDIQLSEAEYPETATYRITANRVRRGESTFTATNSLTGASVQITYPKENGASTIDPSAWKYWGEERQVLWEYLIGGYTAPGLQTWNWIQNGLMDDAWEALESDDQWDRRRRSGAVTSLMGVMGGQAALRETLQLQALRIRHADSVAEIPMNLIEGVTVKSHPFKEMLGDAEGGSYPIANVVPQGRFFLGISKPQALLPILDDGASFLSRIGSGVTGRSFQYNLKDRYFESVGMSEALVRTLIKHQAIDEIVLFAPDLFFIEGTDITTIVRMKSPAGLQLLLKLTRVKESSLGGKAVSVKVKNGEKIWWGLANELVVIGTSQKEVQLAVDLAKNNGAGSLGKSDEFRYMLTKVPFTETTRAYVYFSDPFIRNLVGPKVKIGQFRRIGEKSDMQTMAYAAMLYQHDGLGSDPSVKKLVATGYLPDRFLTAGLSFDSAGIPVSETYGPLPAMKPIYAADLTMATGQEQNAYESYVEEYSRFWRRFFDPIAMRVEEEEGDLVATTYILPLLDNSIYQGVRQVVSSDEKQALRIPQIEPSASAMLSFNVSEEAMVSAIGEILNDFSDPSHADASVVDQLGPAVHFAIFDADPVIAYGSRSLLGMGGDAGDIDEMMGISFMISLLTRPCALMVELQDPEPIRQFMMEGGLQDMLGFMGADDEQVSTYRLGGTDYWVVGIDFWGISLRFSAYLQDNYLIIGNMPWREPIDVTAVVDADVTGASVMVAPGNAVIEKRALHLSAMEGQRQSVLEGLVYLYPLLASGISPDQAVAEHKKIFGFTPVLPEKSDLDWDGLVPGCSGYGNLFAPEQPFYKETEAFGTLQGVGKVRASMQFEETGLRTVVRWDYKAP